MPDHETLAITLPAALAAELRALVESGRYLSPSQAVAEALEDWRDKQRLRAERLASIRARIREADEETEPPLTDDEVAQHLDDVFRATLAARQNA